MDGWGWMDEDARLERGDEELGTGCKSEDGNSGDKSLMRRDVNTVYI